MDVENTIRLYLRIYHNNYLHLNRVKSNNVQQWHFICLGEYQFDLVHPSLKNHPYRNPLLSPLISQLNIQDNEIENYFWSIFNAFDYMFYINGRAIDGKCSSMDNRARLFIALSNNTHDEKLRSKLIKKLLANCFIDVYQLPKHITSHGKRLNVQKIELMDVYPNIS